jgi:hypothetical protein
MGSALVLPFAVKGVMNRWLPCLWGVAGMVGVAAGCAAACGVSAGRDVYS